jgi:CO/xanthine dehydrogenase FAD-binding subunit
MRRRHRRRLAAPSAGDDYLLALAEGENAMVISGNQNLLDLADRFPIRSPRDVLEALETRR